MIPFVPMIPGVYRNVGTTIDVVLVGVTDDGSVITALDCTTGRVGTFPSDMILASTDWLKHYLEQVS